MKDRKNSRVVHSYDFAIVYDFEEDNELCQQYIRFNKSNNTYDWYYQGNEFYLLSDKIEWIKENNL